ncbi:nucleotidyltransferase domain-containing protein [Sphingomonas phyllosphaerae]|uniref:nucleotidyltransferase domain-containing protein n=1 Tax=Sphingomonas phyllosphaerae TaxID=257003 RepID=UPI0024134EF8|nr:nucleotidyltransferase [Sphingomonas phyllosphaerae]
MAIPEAQLETWSHQGSTVQSADTYRRIREALLDSRAPFAAHGFDIFLQGSYGNDTNIYADSDVDVVICLTSTFYEDTDALSAEDRARRTADWYAAGYELADFKGEVAAWLATQFGGGVDASGKAIYVPAGGGRRDADVLACAEFREFFSYARPHSDDYRKGICFWSGATRIENYPRQHADNCVAKNLSSNRRFKPSVRVFKNLRNAMVQRGYVAEGLAPSYFLEGMLSNVPDRCFGASYQDMVACAVGWLRNADPSLLTCANGIHWLLREGHSVCWREAAFETFLTALARFWEEY